MTGKYMSAGGGGIRSRLKIQSFSEMLEERHALHSGELYPTSLIGSTESTRKINVLYRPRTEYNVNNSEQS